MMKGYSHYSKDDKDKKETYNVIKSKTKKLSKTRICWDLPTDQIGIKLSSTWWLLKKSLTTLAQKCSLGEIIFQKSYIKNNGNCFTSFFTIYILCKMPVLYKCTRSRQFLHNFCNICLDLEQSFLKSYAFAKFTFHLFIKLFTSFFFAFQEQN